MRESTLLRTTLEKGRQSRAFRNRYALPVFAVSEVSLGLGLLETVHAEGDLVLGKDNLGTHFDQSKRKGRDERQWSWNRVGDGAD